MPVLAADEVDGSNLTADVNACDYEPAKGKLYTTKKGKTIDCRRYYVMSLYGYQGSEGNVSMGMDPEAMCQGTIYYCEYIGRGKFKRSPINLSYVGNQCKGDHKRIGVRFEAVNGSYAASKRLASSRLSHQCPDEEKPKPDDGKKPKPDDGKKPKPDDGKKPKPDDGKKPKPDDDKKPKPDDDKKPKPDDDKPKPDDDKKPKPDDSKNDKSMEDLLRRINDSLDRLNNNIANSGSGSPGGNGGGGSGGNGGSGNGGGNGGNGGSGNGGGSGGSGGGNGGGSGGGNGSSNGQSGGKDGENGGRCKGDDKNTLGCLTRDDLLGNSSSGDSDDFLPKKEVRLKFNLDNFLGSERLECPKPKVLNLRFYKITLSYEWLCDVLRNIRGVVIMVFSLSGVMFVLKGFK